MEVSIPERNMRPGPPHNNSQSKIKELRPGAELDRDVTKFGSIKMETI